MFSAAQGSTRPKPPSVLRRSANNPRTDNSNKASHSPPPPYQNTPPGDSLDSAGLPGIHRRNLSVCSVSSTANMDVSVTATAQLLGLELASRSPGGVVDEGVDAEEQREKDEAYVREKSREELERLLLKAEAVIRARERELGIAATVGKQLLETNLSLRQRHASILSKTSPLPPTLSPLVPSGTLSPADALTPPMSPITSYRTPGATGSSRHSRRMSTTPAQLAMLNSQNEELLAALTKIQDETSAADLEGKQKLRKLEKEIAGLRSELESSHQKNTELESKVVSVQVEQEHRRQRSNDSDATTKSSSKVVATEEANSSFQNFAPLSTTPVKRAFQKQAAEEKDAQSRPKLVAFPSSDQVESGPSAEYILLSRLLSKIEELENTNRQILARHRETDNRLRNATDKSDALQKVYATLEDEMENDRLHLDADDEYDEGHVGFSSPGNDETFLGNSQSESGRMQALGVSFELPEDTSFEHEPSLRDRGSPISSIHRIDSDFAPAMSASNSMRSRGSRKALSNRLFEKNFERSPPLGAPNVEESDDNHHDPEDDMDLREHPPRLPGAAFRAKSSLRPKPSTSSLGGAKRRLRPKASLDGRLYASSLGPHKGIRPAISYQGLREHKAKRDTVDSTSGRGDTLWNEIKALADDDFIAAQDDEDIEAIDRTIDSILHEHHGLAPPSSKSVHKNPSAEEDEGNDTAKPQDRKEQENRAVSAIREALDPRNAGKPLKDDEHILPVGSLEGSPGESFFLISRAVAARPTQWTGRQSPSLYQDAAARHRKRIEPEDETLLNARADTLYGGASGDGVGGRRAEALERLNEVAHSRTSPNPRARSNRDNRRRDGSPTNDRNAYGRGEGSGTVAKGGRRRRGDSVAQTGLGRTLLEIWIFLQAAIILFVFVYTMARKGPRAIISAAEAKKRPSQ